MSRPVLPWTLVAASILAAAVHGQQLLDRVAARVGTTPVTQSDVRAAIGLGLVDGAGTETEALERLIDRQLVLTEADRFPPPEPEPAAVEAQVAMMKSRAGDGLERLMRTTGVDEPRLRELARETLRIQAYIDERFGVSVQVTEDEARRYYEAHPEQFTANGRPIPFEEAAAEARRRASDEQLRETVEEWLADLRERADIVILAPVSSPPAPPAGSRAN